jgi:integrase
VSFEGPHFVPFFGPMPLARIQPTPVQAWVTQASDKDLSPRSIAKYHVMLHSVFARAILDRVIAFNPCENTELPKVVAKKYHILTPEEFETVIASIPPRFTALVLTDIETGLRWGELIALRPRHVDFLRRTNTVAETIAEVSKKDSPTVERMIVKPYPKDDEPRTLHVSQDLLDTLAARIADLGLDCDHLLFPSREVAGGPPRSRGSFNTRFWRPAITAAGIDFPLRIHDLRHAHASWLLAGGADLKSVIERTGHSQIMTTQKYLHTLPGADKKALAAFESIRRRGGIGIGIDTVTNLDQFAEILEELIDDRDRNSPQAAGKDPGLTSRRGANVRTRVIEHTRHLDVDPDQSVARIGQLALQLGIGNWNTTQAVGDSDIQM